MPLRFFLALPEISIYKANWISWETWLCLAAFLSHDPLSVNPLGVSRCETFDSDQLLSWRRNVKSLLQIVLVGSQFSKKKLVLDFMSGSETHYRNSFIPQATGEQLLNVPRLKELSTRTSFTRRHL